MLTFLFFLLVLKCFWTTNLNEYLAQPHNRQMFQRQKSQCMGPELPLKAFLIFFCQCRKVFKKQQIMDKYQQMAINLTNL